MSDYETIKKKMEIDMAMKELFLKYIPSSYKGSLLEKLQLLLTNMEAALAEAETKSAQIRQEEIDTRRVIYHHGDEITSGERVVHLKSEYHAITVTRLNKFINLVREYKTMMEKESNDDVNRDNNNDESPPLA